MTIKDIAKAAGVSVATVSRVMNHKDSNISQETKDRVLKVINDSGYVPYAKIRDRLLAGNNTIGLAIPTLDSHFYATFATHAQHLAKDNGFALLLAVTGGIPENETFALESFRNSKANGILLFPGSLEGLLALDQLHQEGGCAVVLDHMAKNAVFPQVYRDTEQLARRSTELLMESCDKVALALRKDCGTLSHTPIRSGYHDALRAQNVPIDPSLESCTTDFDLLLDMLIENGVDGILCQDAETAGMVYAAAAKKFVRIPEDLSVLALEDAPLAVSLTPPLSTHAADPRGMAESAMDALLWQIQQTTPEFTTQTIYSLPQNRSSVAIQQTHAPRIAIIGSMNMDVVFHIPSLPRQGETLLAPQLTNWPGGKGANQALGVSRLGGSAHMLGCLGNDRYGKQILEQLSAAEVNMDGVTLTSDHPTGTAYINVCANGDSTIVVHPGANSTVDRDYVRRHQALLRSADYCLVQMEIPFEAVQASLLFCKEHDVRAILKPSPATPLPDELLSGLYMLVPNEEEAHILCPGEKSLEQIAAYFLEKGVQNVIITTGPEGCLWANATGIQFFPAHPFPCVDSTGASDIFISCLAVFLAEGRDLQTAIRAAVWAASYSVAHESVQNAIPDRRLLDASI